jgi:hypothetical protein
MASRLLVYTRTADYRHDSLPDAVAAVRALGGFDVEHTEDPAALQELRHSRSRWTGTRSWCSSPRAGRC